MGGQAQGVGEVVTPTLPVEIHGTMYDVPIRVQLHVEHLRMKLDALGGTRGSHPVLTLLDAVDHCLSAADEGVDYGVSRAVLDAMTTLGLMEKVGRAKWAPTEAAQRFATLARTAPTSAPVGVTDAMVDAACAAHIRDPNNDAERTKPGTFYDPAEHLYWHCRRLPRKRFKQLMRSALELALAQQPAAKGPFRVLCESDTPFTFDPARTTAEAPLAQQPAAVDGVK